jgi:DNA-binding CsgD family transcriptional regulator
MPSGHSVASARQEIVKLCHSGLDSVAFRREAIRRLRRLVPVDSFWFATADPLTLLFTSSLVEEIPEKATPLFVTNELLQDDVNKFTQLAAARQSVNSLYFATKGRLNDSPRYREICVPFGFGDELRAALNAGAGCWGFMCLHREKNGSNFTASEAATLAALAPHLGHGLRAALLLSHAEKAHDEGAPGLLLLAEDLSLVAATPAGERWLAEITDSPSRRELPQVVYGAVARLVALECNRILPPDLLPRARVRTRSGQWLVVHASRLSGRGGPGETAVILEPARGDEVAPLLLRAYGLSRREAEVAQLVLQGLGTLGIASKLSIAENTVQQHLKSVFDKTGVGSRRELVARVFSDHRRGKQGAS